jgi:uncharacterized protein
MRLLCAWMSLAAAAHVNAASFDCTKASTPVEKMVCATPSLSELDEHLARYYSVARAELGAGKSCLAVHQRVWIRMRNACPDAACIERQYLQRLAELDPLQPGASALRNVELPAVKALVWIIPPAEDEVAAPRPASAPPFQVTGRILDETATGDGFVILDAKGVKHPLLTLMFITKSSATKLEALSLQAGATYEATGLSEKSADGTVHFAPGACITVRRLPPE